VNILIVKLSSLGDVVQTMPVVTDLQRAFPNSQIDWVVEEAFAPLVTRVVGVRRVIPVALRRWRRTWLGSKTKQERAAFKATLQEQAYDAIIDCQGLTKSALVARIARLAPSGVRGSFANKSDACGYEWPVKFLLPHNQAMPTRIHAVARTRLLAAKLLGYENTGAPHSQFKDLPTSSVTSNRIFFAHGTTRPDNEWPQWKWENLGEALLKQHPYRVLLPHANAHELAICEGIKRHLGKSAEILPRMGLSEILDVMASCKGVIGVDSGLSHMAVALGLPHVQIFSHDRAWRAGPIDTAHQIAIGGVQAPSSDAALQAWMQVETAASSSPP